MNTMCTISLQNEFTLYTDQIVLFHDKSRFEAQRDVSRDTFFQQKYPHNVCNGFLAEKYVAPILTVAFAHCFCSRSNKLKR